MDKAKHAYGSRANLEAAIQSGKVDAYDVLFLNGEGENPAIGWVDKDKNPIIIENTDISGLESEIAKKADATEVDTKIKTAASDSVNVANAYTDKMIEAAMDEHLTKKYEIANVPDGTLVKINENEIRIMCPANSQWVKQSVGNGGNPNTYYFTFKTHAPDEATGYIEHLGDQVDKEILTDLKTDEYGRKYQPTWLGLANYNEETDTWTYYGANSTSSKMTGWDYQIDWYNADGVMIASDSIRINLSNENCHYAIEPYYVGGMVKTANDYTDAQIEAKMASMAVAYEIVEF